MNMYTFVRNMVLNIQVFYEDTSFDHLISIFFLCFCITLTYGIKIVSILTLSPINEDLVIPFFINVGDISVSDLNSIFDTVEKLGKAIVELFSIKIQEKIS